MAFALAEWLKPPGNRIKPLNTIMKEEPVPGSVQNEEVQAIQEQF